MQYGEILERKRNEKQMHDINDRNSSLRNVSDAEKKDAQGNRKLGKDRAGYDTNFHSSLLLNILLCLRRVRDSIIMSVNGAENG